MPLHQLLCSLLQCYGLELYHLTPSGLLHLTTFVTLCEAYLRIDHDLDLWKYFFSVHHPQDREAKLTIYSGAVIHVKSGHKAYPYLQIPMPSSISGWRKKWFYMKNDDFAPLPAFTGGQPIPLTSWGERAAGKDVRKYNPCVSIFSSCGRRGRPRFTSCGCSLAAGSSLFRCGGPRCGRIRDLATSTILLLRS
jgi:hypothetical protein